MTQLEQGRSRPSVLCCDGPCCGTALSNSLGPIAPDVRLEVATCLSECEKAPVVRLRYDTDDGSRAAALLSGANEPDLSRELADWARNGAPGSLSPRLRAAQFTAGEGGGCLCDEAEAALAPTTAEEALPG